MFYSNGQKKFAPAGTAGSTPDGRFVITDLAPGRYYLRASDKVQSASVAQDGSRSAEALVPTYFPNVAEAGSALPIQVPAGSEVNGLEIRLRRERVFTVSGRIAGTQAPANDLMLMLVSDTGDLLRGSDDQRFATVSNGAFVFTHVPTGQYIIQPSARSSGQLFGRQRISVRDDDVKDVDVFLGPGPEMLATVSIEGNDRSVDYRAMFGDRPFLMLLSAEGLLHAPPPTVHRINDRTVRISGLVPAKYYIEMSLADGAGYVKSIHFNDRDITHEALDLAPAAGGKLHVVVSRSAAGVSGAVRDSEGTVVTGGMVVLWSPNRRLPGRFEVAKVGRVDQNGSFAIKNLAPGAYRIAAFQDIDINVLQDLQFLARFSGKSTEIVVSEGAGSNVTLEVLNQATVEEEIAKLQW
jgi:hypothetical protein